MGLVGREYGSYVYVMVELNDDEELSREYVVGKTRHAHMHAHTYTSLQDHHHCHMTTSVDAVVFIITQSTLSMSVGAHIAFWPAETSADYYHHQRWQWKEKWMARFVSSDDSDAESKE